MIKHARAQWTVHHAPSTCLLPTCNQVYKNQQITQYQYQITQVLIDERSVAAAATVPAACMQRGAAAYHLQHSSYTVMMEHEKSARKQIRAAKPSGRCHLTLWLTRSAAAAAGTYVQRPRSGSLKAPVAGAAQRLGASVVSGACLLGLHGLGPQGRTISTQQLQEETTRHEVSSGMVSCAVGGTAGSPGQCKQRR